ncbi:MAG: dTMP kinase [Planctomycetota bacterium]
MSDLAEKLAGRFIVLDGPDGSGKSTQLARLATWLRGSGLEVIEIRDPGGTAVGDRIREILLDAAHAEMTVGCETLLYMASRAQLWPERIAPALADGACVLCDRWVSATVAYQGAGGADPADILAIYRKALPGVQPDLTVVLDLDAETGLARTGREGNRDRMESRDAAFHRRVRELFLTQAQREPERFVVVDAGGDVDAVQNRLREAIRQWQPA